MAYEIDFLAIGEESRSGDAITLRFGDLNGPREAQTVVVVDGGFTDDGVKVIKHLAEYYHTDRADIVVAARAVQAGDEFVQHRQGEGVHRRARERHLGDAVDDFVMDERHTVSSAQGGGVSDSLRTIQAIRERGRRG